jgi:hypothetical protein
MLGRERRRRTPVRMTRRGGGCHALRGGGRWRRGMLEMRQTLSGRKRRQRQRLVSLLCACVCVNVRVGEGWVWVLVSVYTEWMEVAEAAATTIYYRHITRRAAAGKRGTHALSKHLQHLLELNTCSN